MIRSQPSVCSASASSLPGWPSSSASAYSSLLSPSLFSLWSPGNASPSLPYLFWVRLRREQGNYFFTQDEVGIFTQLMISSFTKLHFVFTSLYLSNVKNWWSETCKSNKYNKKERNQEWGKNLFTALQGHVYKGSWQQHASVPAHKKLVWISTFLIINVR